VGLALLHASDSGAQGTMIELATAVAAPAATARFMTRSTLVRSLVGSEEETIERSERLVSSLVKEYPLRTDEGRSRLHADVLRKCREAVDLLASLARPGEAVEYARWLLLVGERVAEAATETRRPGGPEHQVSDAESAALREIAAALRLGT